MLIPKKVKHRKWHKGRRRGSLTESRGTKVSYGSYGLKALEASRLTSRQIEAARRTVSNFTKRGGKFWIRVFPDKPITKRPPEVTMGGGKGAVDHYVFLVKPGRVLFEIDGVTEATAMRALTLAGHKLPVKTKVVKEN
ncbi:MAG: 50S ribosomal protein L16 [Candidatus Colwellbacteria bacterium RIFCSPHIGHO2_12_FULL_43_12]|uniref:Large ribosomal subunit protein uL16 n=3 Tax=Candidatus Colwelliibacteriota TaxID=1817904 RepID=A0A1G1Z031_9BACT|nr:MAG: 50S ribosomal protein L16 [Candidatus Colwellbacteria bacterium RIFCSPHIGHO2_02_FULL_43_15]OGY58340.1 MAG: 50S ribosomal protein L16 [Candidatus Colwellbacteria bacterium RIFCSPHIGHO2_12_FULL_43_12]OGY60711.1 MAG: 50S ribosomal protein L16 [Candidatus Colwellbacteria bacterium RIFCSPLOWO2_12_FULL_43_11]